MINLILNAREDRSNNVKSLLKKYPYLIVVKANIPGSEKLIKEAYLLVKLFTKLIKSKLKINDESFFSSYDGPYYLLMFDNTISGNNLKLILTEIEDNHPLGRYIDIDLYDNKGVIYSRNKLRKCYICNYDAIICMRNNTHSLEELITKIKEDIKQYLINNISILVDKSVLYELNLHPKFGLVTPFSKGSHEDMDYELMLKAKNSITPNLINMFMVGYEQDNINNIFPLIKQLGIEAEQSMLNQTNNINAYKGLIFVLGLALASSGYVIKNNQPFDDIFNNINKIYPFELNESVNTFGLYAYKQLNFGGVRKEVLSGLPTVKQACNYLNKYQEINDETIMMTLIEIIKLSEDSVLLKRSKSLENYHKYKDLIKKITTYDKKMIADITNIFIANNLSIGGSADLLITTLFIHLINEQFI